MYLVEDVKLCWNVKKSGSDQKNTWQDIRCLLPRLFKGRTGLLRGTRLKLFLCSKMQELRGCTVIDSKVVSLDDGRPIVR